VQRKLSFTGWGALPAMHSFRHVSRQTGMKGSRSAQREQPLSGRDLGWSSSVLVVAMRLTFGKVGEHGFLLLLSDDQSEGRNSLQIFSGKKNVEKLSANSGCRLDCAIDQGSLAS
jgi:hypothetical protein